MHVHTIGSCKPALSYVEVLVKSDMLAFNEDINCRTTSEDFGGVLEDHSPEIFNQTEHTTLSLDLTSHSDVRMFEQADGFQYNYLVEVFLSC